MKRNKPLTYPNQTRHSVTARHRATVVKLRAKRNPVLVLHTAVRVKGVRVELPAPLLISEAISREFVIAWTDDAGEDHTLAIKCQRGHIVEVRELYDQIAVLELN